MVYPVPNKFAFTRKLIIRTKFWSIHTSLGCPTRDRSRVWYRINSVNNQLISYELLQKIDNRASRYTFKTTISGEVISVAFLKDNKVFISKGNNNNIVF